MLTLTPQVLQLVLAGIQVAPEVIALAQQEIAAANGGTALTDDQKAAIDAALAQSHADLQAAQPAASP